MKIPSSEHGENMLCTEIDFDIQNNLCTQHVLPMFCKNKSFQQRFTCTNKINVIVSQAGFLMYEFICLSQKYVNSSLQGCTMNDEFYPCRLLHFLAKFSNFVLVKLDQIYDQNVCVLLSRPLISYYLFKYQNTNALSFYVTKTVLVGPKWFWSDQIDLDLTIMI